MLENQEQEKKNNFTEEKIPPYRRRLFWGVVMAPILIFGGFILLFEMPFMILKMFPGGSPYPSVILIYLPYGFILGISILIPFEISAYSFYVKTISTPLSHFLSIIYCIILLFLFYKTFKEKRVKIKYPLIVIAIIIISLFGFFVLQFAPS